MKFKKDYIILSVIIFVISAIGIYQKVSNANTTISSEGIVLASSKASMKVEDEINLYINENGELIDFYSHLMGIEKESLLAMLVEDHEESFEPYDLLNTGVCENTYDHALLKYLLAKEETNKDLFHREYEYQEVSKEYIYGLIEYFATYYENVDVSTLKAIAYIESGNLNAKSMLKKNNIFGGMANGKLTEYPTIEYGVFRYVKLMSEGYYGKGLTTVQSIGKVYNPVIENGTKKANPTWVSNVLGVDKKNFTDEITYTSISLLNEVK